GPRRSVWPPADLLPRQRLTAERDRNELSPAEHALGAGKAGAQRAIRGDYPERAGEHLGEAGNLVVSAWRADQVRRLLRRLAVEDDPQLVTLALRPRARPRDQLLTGEVRPAGAADVLSVDDDERHPARRPA